MKILLFDDHKIFSRSFQLLLKDVGYSNAIVCETPECVQNHINKNEPLLIFSDFMIPDLDIFQLVTKWKSFKNVHLVIMSSISSPYQIARLLKNHVDGFISKSVEPQEITNCIKDVLNGKTYISNDLQDEVMKILINQNETLFTARELEIISLIKEGKTIKEKAKILFLSENTIIVHRRNIMQKAGVKSITELVIKIDTLL